MKILKPETPVYTVREGNVVKGTVKTYIRGKGYLVSFSARHADDVIARDRLFLSIDAAIDDYQRYIIGVAARLEMQRPKQPRKECAL